jgi:hypothetical protein
MQLKQRCNDGDGMVLVTGPNKCQTGLRRFAKLPKSGISTE